MLINNHNIPSMPSRKKATIINLTRDYASMGILIIRGFVLVPIYLDYIDARLYGAWLATGSIVAFLGLLDFGFSSVIVQKAANIGGQKDYNRLGKLIGTSLVITCLLASLPLLVASILFMRVPAWVNIEGAGALQIAKAFWIAGASTSLMLIAYGVGGILLGLQWVGVLTVQFIISSLIGIIATLIFLYMGWGVLSIPWGFLVQSALLSAGHCAYLWWWIRRNLQPKSLSFELATFKNLFQESLWVFVSKLSNTAARQSDNLIIAAMIDPRLTTILVLTRKSTDIVTTIVARISSAFMPSLAHLSGEADITKLRRYMLGVSKISLMVGLFGVGGIFLLNEEFVRLWVGGEFYGGTLLTGLICVSGFIFVFNTAVYNNIFAKGEISTASKATMLEAIVRVPLSIALCYYFGIKGVVLAAIIAVLPTSLWIQMRCFLKILNLQWHEVLQSLSILFFKAFIPVAVGLLLRTFWTPNGLAEFFAFGAIYLIFGMIFYVLVDSDLRQFVGRIFDRLIKNKHFTSFIKTKQPIHSKKCN